MDPNSLFNRYQHLFPELKRLSRAENRITEENVFQPANTGIRAIMDKLCGENMTKESEFRNLDHAADFLDKIKNGKRGIILMEHYSNFDLPGIMYLLGKAGPVGEELSKRIIAVAGMKLNEDDPLVSAFAEAYSRIIIYPSRSLASIKDPETYKREEQRSRVINLASMRALDRIRKEKCGTRIPRRNPVPSETETKRGVREINSYIRISDVMMLVS